MKSLYDVLHVVDPVVEDARAQNIAQDAAEEKAFFDLAAMTGKEFSDAILSSRQYRESIIRRLKRDTLPSAVECKLLDHSLGAPVKRVEHTGSLTVDKIERVVVDVATGAEQRVH